jgi:hypothetical protein
VSITLAIVGITSAAQLVLVVGGLHSIRVEVRRIADAAEREVSK